MNQDGMVIVSLIFKIDMSNSDHKSKKSFAQIFWIIISVGEKNKLILDGLVHREEYILPSIFAMRREIYPLFVIVIERIIKVEPGWRCRHANIDSVVSYQIPNEVIYLGDLPSIDSGIRRCIIRLVVDNNFIF